MNDTFINSMTPLNAPIAIAPRTAPLSVDSTAEGSELAQLARLAALLRSLEELLSTGKAEEIPELCRKVAFTTQQLSTQYEQSLIGSLAHDDQRRRAALNELRRGHALCAALLRRWRRILNFRLHASQTVSETVTYRPALIETSELK